MSLSRSLAEFSRHSLQSVIEKRAPDSRANLDVILTDRRYAIIPHTKGLANGTPWHLQQLKETTIVNFLDN
jgi:hypothetical protein